MNKDDLGMMRTPIRPAGLLVAGTATLVALLSHAETAAGQYLTPPPPAAYAVENVTVVQPDGSLSPGMTLVVRDGRIEVLAAGEAVPADARVLEGDSLRLYPGLVDAHGAAEVTWPEARDVPDPDAVRSWDPPRSRQGFLPHRRVADHLSATGAALEDSRSAGVVASLVHPEGGMAPGQAAVLVHRAAETPWHLVHDDDAGLALSFQSAGGVYPSQLFGVIAYLRQAFLDAERYETLRTATDGDGGVTVPGWDPDYEALRRAVRGEVPVYFSADSDEDIRRALDLSEEAGFRLVVVGGSEAWKLADELAERQVPVLVSLDFPRPTDWDPEADTAAAALEPAAAREKERIEAVWANAGRLEAAGVPFALTSGGGAAELIEGARKAVEYGLSPAGALRAITTTPAEMLGLDAHLRVRQGGSATFVLADADLLGDEASVRYTFVEGRLTEGAGGGGGGGDEPAADVTGTWTGEISVGGQAVAFTLELTQSDDGSLSGTMSASEMPTSPISGRISGSQVTINIEAEGMPEPIRLTGTLDDEGDRMTGTGDSPFGPMSFDASRRPGGSLSSWLGGAR